MARIPDGKNTIIEALGMKLLPPDGEKIRAVMPVDQRTCQPFGMLSGGASLALAETLAGFASLMRCADGEIPCGVQISASHVAAVPLGHQVMAIAAPLHLGKALHVWNVEIRDDHGTIVSLIRVTNRIVSPGDAVASEK
ncbi:MAG: hotdog fold thioesterase [Desulfovibrionaceae bacterium]|nr:hotdog fold thioesterase [Desulfovibrionaceae bacterium]